MPLKSNGFLNAPRKQSACPLGGEGVARTIKTLGYCVSFQRVNSTKGDGTEHVYVSVYRQGNSCFGRKKLGRLEDLLPLSQEDLRQLIAKKFVPNAAKLSLEDRADLVITRQQTTLPSEDDTAVKGWDEYDA